MRWLLIKSGDEKQRISAARLHQSALTKRTINAIANDTSNVWHSKP